jgi:hypothetical protein
MSPRDGLISENRVLLAALALLACILVAIVADVAAV